MNKKKISRLRGPVKHTNLQTGKTFFRLSRYLYGAAHSDFCKFALLKVTCMLTFRHLFYSVWTFTLRHGIDS